MNQNNKNKRIYIVDDEKSILVALERLLRSSGFCHIKTFSSANEFLDFVKSEMDGILILDVCMPGMGGFELKKEIKKINPDLDTIFMTAHVQEDTYKISKKLQAISLLEKPFDEEELIDLIGNC